MTRRASIAGIQGHVARRYGISVQALMGPGKRPDHVTRIRDVALWCAGVMTLHSTTSIAGQFGGLHETIVQDAIRRVTARRTRDPEFRRVVTDLVATIDPIHRHKEYAR